MERLAGPGGGEGSWHSKAWLGQETISIDTNEELEVIKSEAEPSLDGGEGCSKMS